MKSRLNFGLGSLIFVVLLVLKLTGSTQLSWPVVLLAPLIPLAVSLAVFFLGLLFVGTLAGMALLAEALLGRR